MGRKTEADPTGQAGNRARSLRRLRSRLSDAEKKIKARFERIPRNRRIVANQKTVYSYDLTAEQTQALQADIRSYLDEDLGTDGNTVAADWFWRTDLELPYRQGTTEEIVAFNRNVVGAALAAGVLVRGMKPQRVPAETVLFSKAYRDELNKVYIRDYTSIKTLSSRTADQVIQRINAGISSGKTPSQITDEIVERFDVAKSEAKRTVTTSINQAYNDAKLRATDLAAGLTGLNAGVRHISALMPTTRDNHAARHGHYYTISAQEQWWNTGSNRINCHCSTESVLFDESGNPVAAE